MSQEELKPCLHCGCTEAEAYRIPCQIAMECNNCHAMGPSKPTKAEAIAAWNRRFVCHDKNKEPVKLGWYYAESPTNGTGEMHWGYIGKDMPDWCPDGAPSCESLEVVWQWYCDAKEQENKI